MMLEKLLQPSQKKLFAMLRKMYFGRAFCKQDKFILVSGESPIMLVAHLDTVHRETVKMICTSKDGNVLMSPQGIGGDDRCGVYALVNVYEKAEKKPWLLFTCDEEVGGVGASSFCDEYEKGGLPKSLNQLKMMVEIDRRGSRDAVYYDCANKEFEAYITSKGFKTERGSFSDISFLAPQLHVAAVNLSSGYYNAHTQHEVIVRSEIDAVIEKVIEMVADVTKPDFPKYNYIEKVKPVGYYGAGGYYSGAYRSKNEPAKSLPEQYRQMYNELLDLYLPADLESYRRECGDEIIRELYDIEYGLECGTKRTVVREELK